MEPRMGWLHTAPLQLAAAAAVEKPKLTLCCGCLPAELYGRVLRVNYAQPMKIKGGDKGWAAQPVWADADDW
jgi:hypothetical protein